MVDFRRNASTRSFLSRREQLRMLLLVMALGLVLVMMFEAAKPQRWYWLWGGRPPVDGTDTGASETDAGEVAAADTIGTSRPDRQTVEPSALEGDDVAGVDTDLLKAVTDDSPFRSAEHRAWFELAAYLRRTPEERLEAESIGEVTFLQLYDQPAVYRGKLVTISGKARRAVYVNAVENSDAIEGYYQLWIQPSDSGSDLLVAYVLELPPSFPTGESINEEIETAAFFFKRWAYRAQDRIRTAPLLIAKTVDWQPAPSAARPELPNTWLVVLGGAAMCAVIVWLAWRQSPSRGMFRGAAIGSAAHDADFSSFDEESEPRGEPTAAEGDSK